MKSKKTILKEKLIPLAKILSDKLNSEGFKNENPVVGLSNDNVLIRIYLERNFSFELDDNEFFKELRKIKGFSMSNIMTARPTFVLNTNDSIEDVEDRIINLIKSKALISKFQL